MLELYTRKEVAEHLKVSTKTVWRLTHEGKLEAVKVGSSVRYTEQAIEKLVEQSRVVE
jgi:excisionase family DNA binding protein